ncbi:SDR family NAD(P)-dependent oxidoreductase [Streptomyces hoynatensis]|nr:SDR family NAD(P)-dependent oxidoreductase [Streptomyces hoynatensis]
MSEVHTPRAVPAAGARTVVLVGATSGIGWQAARQLAARGHRLLFVGRDERRGRRLAAALARHPGGAEFIPGDVSTLAGIEAVAGRIGERTDRVDTLLNNAGVMVPRRRLTAEGIELNFAVHHLAPYSTTGLLLPLLARGEGRVVNTNSEGHRATLSGGRVELDFADLQSERGYQMFLAYSRTKLANLLFTHEFQRRNPRFTMVALHPGMVRTRLVRGLRNPALWLFNRTARYLLASPARGARPLVHLATAPEVMPGRYYDRFTPVAPSAQSLDREAAARLWEITEELRGPFPRTGLGGRPARRGTGPAGGA